MNNETDQYALSHTSPESPLLYRIHRETHLRQAFPRMLSGPVQGMLLKMVSCMIRPDRILEIGTFTGYSAICLAQGLNPGGRLDTIEINPELEDLILDYMKEAGLEDRVRLHIGDALDLMVKMEGPYDLVFIDADKEQYLSYYQCVIDKVRSGGFILADNVLWGGKVLQEVLPSDKEAFGIQRFNEFVMKDPRVEKLLLPLRDGVMILRKC